MAVHRIMMVKYCACGVANATYYYTYGNLVY